VVAHNRGLPVQLHQAVYFKAALSLARTYRPAPKQRYVPIGLTTGTSSYISGRPMSLHRWGQLVLTVLQGQRPKHVPDVKVHEPVKWEG
jgi:hypothetical protein